VHAFDVNYRSATTDDAPALPLSIWEPNNAQSGESLPLVLLSSGLGGSSRSLSGVAQALAARGMVVISPQHSSDHLIGSDQHLFFMENRADEMLRSREWALNNLAIDPERIGLFGYSQGGLTVMITAGALPDRFRAQTHCQKNRANDRGYCGYAPFWQTVIEKLGLANIGEDRDDPDENFTRGRPFMEVAAFAVAAPVAAIVPPEEFAKINAEIGIFSFGADRVLAPKYHADHLHDALGDRPHTYKRYPGASHGGLYGASGDQVSSDIVDFFAEQLLP